jgi:hypothetical protein
MIVPLIESNKDFIAAEAVDFVHRTYPDFKFDNELLRRDVHMVIDIFMGELHIKGGVYSYDIEDGRDISSFQLNRYIKSFIVFRNHSEQTINCIQYTADLIKKVITNQKVEPVYNTHYQQSYNNEQEFDKEKLNEFDTICSLIIANSNSGSNRNYHIDFIEEYFDKGFIVTKIPPHIHEKLWQEVKNTKWIDAEKTTYKKIPDWYHENEKHYVDPTGFDRPSYERKIAADIFTNAPKSLIDISDELIRDPLFDPLRMYRPPNPVTKFLHFWNGSENSPHHVDAIDGSDLMVFCYLTEAENWKEEWGGYINILKEVNSEITNTKIVLPNNGVMVLVNNSAPIFKHGIRNLVKKDVNRYTYIFHYTWTY